MKYPELTIQGVNPEWIPRAPLGYRWRTNMWDSNDTRSIEEALDYILSQGWLKQQREDYIVKDCGLRGVKYSVFERIKE